MRLPPAYGMEMEPLDQAPLIGSPRDIEADRLVPQRKSRIEVELRGLGPEHVVLAGLELLETDDFNALAA